MRLAWTTPALVDRIAIYDHIEADDPWAAAALDDQIMDAAERLRSHPEMGRAGRVPGTRELIAHPHYILIYSIDDETILILAVVHTSRQWPPLDS